MVMFLHQNLFLFPTRMTLKVKWIWVGVHFIVFLFLLIEYAEYSEADYFADQTGVWEIRQDSVGTKGKVMEQVWFWYMVQLLYTVMVLCKGHHTTTHHLV